MEALEKLRREKRYLNTQVRYYGKRCLDQSGDLPCSVGGYTFTTNTMSSRNRDLDILTKMVEKLNKVKGDINLLKPIPVVEKTKRKKNKNAAKKIGVYSS